MIDRDDFVPDEDWARFREISKDFPTPNIFVNLDTIEAEYKHLMKTFPFGNVYFAVKANPGIPVIRRLNELGSNFDIASRYELDDVLAQGISPDRLSYGNTIKKAADRNSQLSVDTIEKICIGLNMPMSAFFENSERYRS